MVEFAIQNPFATVVITLIIGMTLSNISRAIFGKCDCDDKELFKVKITKNEKE